MKKIIMLLGWLLLLAGCHAMHHHSTYAASQEKPLKVVASTFPVYLFTANVCAGLENVKLELLIPASMGCPHDFTLRPADMRRLAQADVLVINGAGLEDFLDKAISGLKKAPIIIDASKNVTKMPAGSHDHGHEHGEGHEHGGINPHIFAAPGNAAIMALNIAKGLAEADPVEAEKYLANGEKYSASLDELGSRFEAIGKKAANRDIGLEHDALVYLARNANLQIVAVFESGDSASAIAKLVARLKEEKPALLAGDSQYSDRLLKTISDETGLPFAMLDPCASGPADAQPDYYQKVMEKNLAVLEAHFE